MNTIIVYELNSQLPQIKNLTHSQKWQHKIKDNYKAFSNLYGLKGESDHMPKYFSINSSISKRYLKNAIHKLWVCHNLFL